MNAINKIKHYRYIIFDFDETIATLNIDWSSWYRGIENIFRKYDISYMGTLGSQSEQEIQNVYIQKYGETIRFDLLEFVKDYEKKNSKGIIPITRTLKLLNQIDSNRSNLYIWSSNSSSTISKYLSELGVYDKFAKIVSRDDVYYIKPKTDGFNIISGTLANQNKSDFIFIGDSDADIGAAKEIGIEFLNVADIDQ